MGINNDRVGHGAVFPLDVAYSGSKIPAVTDVDGEAVVDRVDGADDGVVPLVHAGGSIYGLITELEADNAVHAVNFLRHKNMASLAELQVSGVAPKLGFSAAGSAVDLAVCATRDGMEVD